MILIFSIASATLIITPLIIILLLAMPFFEKKYTAGGRHILWILVMVCLCLPFVSFVPNPAIQIHMPIPNSAAADKTAQIVNPLVAGLENTLSFNNNVTEGIAPSIEGSNLMENNPQLNNNQRITGNNAVISPSDQASDPLRLPLADIFDIILFLWSAGIFISLAYHTVNHFSFKRFVRRWSVPESDTNNVIIFNDLVLSMGINNLIELKRCKGIKAPMLIGFIKPSVLLPALNYEAEDLEFIFRHELTHYKRRDLWYKLALVIIKSIYWFNPAVHLMTKQANKDIETICDTLTVRGLSMEYRKRYSKIILSMASGARFYRSQLTTHFLGGKNMLKQRFSNILGGAKKSGIMLFVFMGVVVVSIGLMFGINFNPTHADVLAAIQTASDESTGIDLNVSPIGTIYHEDVTALSDSELLMVDEDMDSNSGTVLTGIFDGHEVEGIMLGSINFNNSGAVGRLAAASGDGAWVVVVFPGTDVLWFIPPGYEITEENSIPKTFDEWIYETYGITSSDTAAIDDLLEQSYRNNSYRSLFIIGHLNEGSSAKILELFYRSAEDSKSGIFSTLQSSVAHNITTEEWDEIGESAYKRGDTSIFSLAAGYLSDDKMSELFTRSIAESNSSFFSLLRSRASSSMTTEDWDKIGENAYGRGDTSIFSLAAGYLSDDKISELFTRSIMESNPSFFSLLQSRASSSMTKEDWDEIGEMVFNRGDTAIFSLVLSKISQEERERLLTRAIAENRTAFVSLLQR